MSNLVNTIRGMYEKKDPNEYDKEGQMSKTQLRTMSDAAKELQAMLKDDENMPEWVQSKITKAADYIDSVRDYMKNNENSVKEEVQIAESHFKVGDEVKCKESGMTGKVVKVDPEGKGAYYTVKRSDGKEMKYEPKELMKEEVELDEARRDAPKGDKNTSAQNPVVVIYDDLGTKGRAGISGNMNIKTFMSIHGISAKFQSELVKMVTKAGKGKKVEVPAKMLDDHAKEYKDEGKRVPKVWIELNTIKEEVELDEAKVTHADESGPGKGKALKDMSKDDHIKSIEHHEREMSIADKKGQSWNVKHHQMMAKVHRANAQGGSSMMYKEELQIDEALETRISGGKVPVGQHTLHYKTDKSHKYISNSIKERDPDAKISGKDGHTVVHATAQAHSGLIKSLRDFRSNGVVHDTQASNMKEETMEEGTMQRYELIKKAAQKVNKADAKAAKDAKKDTAKDKDLNKKEVEEAKKNSYGLTQSLLDAVNGVLKGDSQLDKVDPEQAKKDFKDRKDKDIDNDGDVDNTDKYMHAKRKAVTKAVEKDKTAKGKAEENKSSGKNDGKDKTGKEKVEVNPSINEEALTDDQKRKREEIVQSMKKNAEQMKNKYGDRWKEVMYATATKMALKHEGLEFYGKEEFFEAAGIPFEGPYKKKDKPQRNSDGTKTSPMSRAKQLAKKGMKNERFKSGMEVPSDGGPDGGMKTPKTEGTVTSVGDTNGFVAKTKSSGTVNSVADQRGGKVGLSNPNQTTYSKPDLGTTPGQGKLEMNPTVKKIYDYLYGKK